MISRIAIVLVALWPACRPGVAQGEASGTLQLSLKQAIELALAPDGNAKVQLAQELVRLARAQSDQARAALLPNIDASVGQQSQTRNLEAFGIGLNPLPGGFQFPRFVGPFNTFDARVTARQSVFDLSSIRRFQASRAGLGAAEEEKLAAEDQVIGEVARLYLGTLRAESVLDEAGANVKLAEQLLQLAQSQKEVGTGTGIEVTRARVHLSDQRQRLLVAENELSRARLQLARAMGIDFEAPLQLTDRMEEAGLPPPEPLEALATALESRSDWRAQQKRLEGARLAYGAAKSERLPSVGVFGDYGAIGLAIDDSLPTRTYGFTVRVPLWDGGGRDARRGQAASQYRQEQVRTDDLRAQIELEVRLSLDSLRSARDQVNVAAEGLALAESELAQAQRRYQAGVAIGLEVTDAQTRLERARENRTSALFNYNLARIQLSVATGTVRQVIQ